MDHYMIRQELNPETCRLDTKQCRYVWARVPGGCLRWPPTSPGPRWPPALKLELERERTKEEKEREVLHLFRCYTHTHREPGILRRIGAFRAVLGTCGNCMKLQQSGQVTHTITRPKLPNVLPFWGIKHHSFIIGFNVVKYKPTSITYNQ